MALRGTGHQSRPHREHGQRSPHRSGPGRNPRLSQVAVGQLEGTFTTAPFAKALCHRQSQSASRGEVGLGVASPRSSTSGRWRRTWQPRPRRRRKNKLPTVGMSVFRRKLTINGNNNLIRGDVNSPSVVAGNNNELDGRWREATLGEEQQSRRGRRGRTRTAGLG